MNPTSMSRPLGGWASPMGGGGTRFFEKNFLKIYLFNYLKLKIFKLKAIFF